MRPISKGQRVVVRCPVKGAYLVRDETEPIPAGKTATDVSVVVYRYSWGWACQGCGTATGTTRPECEHVIAAKRGSR